MNPTERRAALVLAAQARRGGWTQAAFADVLASLGLMEKDHAEAVAIKLDQDPDPHYQRLCPGGVHPYGDNVYRDKHYRIRCSQCSADSRDRAKLRRE